MKVAGTDFTKINHDVLVIVIGDEESPRKLSIRVPTKGLYDKLMVVAGYIDNINAGEDIDEHDDMVKDSFEFTALALSNNSEGIEITPEYLDEINFTTSDVSLFLMDYIMFLGAVAEAKNSRSPSTHTEKAGMRSTTPSQPATKS